MSRILAAALATGTCILAIAAPSHAREQAQAQTREYNIPAGSLQSTLDAYARQSGRQVIYRVDDVRGSRSRGVRGNLTADAALDAVLLGTKFKVRIDSTGAIAIVQSEASPKAAQSRSSVEGAQNKNEPIEQEIVVTGTRIRGAGVISDIVKLDREAIVEAGQVDLGEAIRAIPQNFSGGQNPGVGTGAGITNENVNSASSPNLRGLGADATLTLLNGQRLPYNSAFQGVDISAIPLAAVERIEVVPDGASALYGSDAVGGVINVILRRNFEGVTTSAQLGASTDGGNFRQQADIVAGQTWDSGGVMLAYDYAHNSRITASQRRYGSSRLPEATFFPEMERHAVTLSGHQAVAPGIEANIDALYSYRRSETADGTAQQRILREPDLEGFSIAPSVRFDIGSAWQGNLAGVFGRDRTRFRTSFLPAGGAPRISTGGYLNEIVSLELGAEGPLFTLPGGDARLALGGGFRNTALEYELQSAAINTAFDATQGVRFAYAELYLPVIAPSNDVAAIDLLTLTAAVRYEDYRDLDQVATPRFAANYSPFDGLTFRGSWSRSFKAPTLFQQNLFTQALLIPAAAFGAGTGTQTVFLSSGGNPDVRPERARSWTLGLEFEPASVPDLSMSATWFDVSFDNRVVVPIAGSIASALSNPGFASLIDFDPDPASLAELIAGAQFGLENFTGRPYDPANVVALVDNRNINVAAWRIEGIDARVRWDRDLGDRRSVGVELSGSWLDSEQALTESLPTVSLSGTVFNPPKYRARGTVRFQWEDLTVNLAGNYQSALIDRRPNDTQRLAPWATLDLGLRYTAIRRDGRDPGLEFSITVQNLFDKEPEVLRLVGPTSTPFDSTNFSAIGRFVAFGIRRHW